jgi:hypothetical protein
MTADSTPIPPVEGDYGQSIEQLGPLIAWLNEQCDQAANAGQSKDAGMLLWASQVVGERVDEDAPSPTDSTPIPPAEGEVRKVVAQIRLSARNSACSADPAATRAAELLQQHAAELAQCREALRRVRRWGGCRVSDRWDSGVVLGVMAWIDDGMTGPLPAMPSYLASLEGNGNA